VRAFCKFRAPIANGSKVRLTGVYRMIVHDGKNTWVNELNAATVDVLDKK
jgi:hypothetical protein